MVNVMTQDTVINDKSNGQKIQFISARQKEILEIKKSIRKGYSVTFSKTNNWVRINGVTYNGFKRETIEQIIKEVTGDNNDLQK